MVKRTELSKTSTLAELLPPSTELQESRPAFNPLMPWLTMSVPIQLEYRMIEIRLGGGEASIHGERKTLRDGELFEESIDARLPAEFYLEAAERMQTMVQALMMPWTAMMLPFFQRKR